LVVRYNTGVHREQDEANSSDQASGVSPLA
jgi:hypothetical protein